MNESQKRNPVMLKKWEISGALGAHGDSLMRSYRSAENPRSLYEERFGKLQNEIMETLRPGSGLTIFCGDGEHPMEDNNLSIDKKGKWTRIKLLDDGGFRGVLREYAVARALNQLSRKEIDINEYSDRLPEVIKFARKHAEDNPIPFATRLLARMEQALSRYKENPY